MSKSIKVVRTFPNAWYGFIVEGDVKSLSAKERLVAESVLAAAFPDGGDIVAVKKGTKPEKYSTLVCESYSVNGCMDKNVGKTFKARILVDKEKHPKSFNKYVTEASDVLTQRRFEALRQAEEEFRKKWGSDNGNTPSLSTAELGLSAGKKPTKDASDDEKAAYDERKRKVDELRKRKGYDVDELKAELRRLKKEKASDDEIAAVQRQIDDRNREWSRFVNNEKNRGKQTLTKSQQSDKDDDRKNVEHLRRTANEMDAILARTGGDQNAFDTIAATFDEWKKEFGTELSSNFDDNELDSDDESEGETERVEEASGDESTRSKTKSPDGSDVITLVAAANKLRKEIVDAYAADDMEKVERFRKFVPILAYSIAKKAGRRFRKMAGATDVNHTMFQYMVDVLYKLYDVAFGLVDHVAHADELKKLLGDRSDFAIKALTDGVPEHVDEKARREYAKFVIDQVMFGDNFTKACMAEVSDSWLATQNTDTPKKVRSLMNLQYIPFTRWFNGKLNRKAYGLEGNLGRTHANVSRGMYEYALGEYVLDSVSDMLGDVTGDVKMLDADTFGDGEITIDKVLAAFQGGRYAFNASEVDTSSSDLAASEGDKLACLRGALVRLWKKRGLKCDVTIAPRYFTVKVGESAPFDGTLDEFKEAFDKSASEDADLIESKMGELQSDFEKKRTELKRKISLDELDWKNVDKFELWSSSVFDRKGAFIQFFRPFITSNMYEFLYSSLDKLQEQLKVDASVLRSETGFTDKQAAYLGVDPENVDTGKQLVRGLTADDELQSGETGGDDVLAGRLRLDATQGARKQRETPWFKRSNAFVDSTPEQVGNMAEALGLDVRRAKNIHEWWTDVTSTAGGIGAKLGWLNKGVGDEEMQADRKRIENLIHAEANRREAAYNRAQEALNAARASGDEAEIKAAEDEVAKAEARRTMTDDDEKEVIRRFNTFARVERAADIAKTDLELTPAKDKNPTGKQGALRKDVYRAGVDARDEVLKEHMSYINPEGTEDDKYKGVPDLLALLAYDDIIDYMSDEDVSVETAVTEVANRLRSEFSEFVVRATGLDKIASLRGMSESVDAGGSLDAVEKLLDLVEGCEEDARVKLAMVEFIEGSFKAWCAENDIEPKEINPADDEDAVDHHPEDL